MVWSGLGYTESRPGAASIFLLITNYEQRSIICSGLGGREWLHWLQWGGQSLIKEILICLMSSGWSVGKINGNRKISSTNWYLQGPISSSGLQIPYITHFAFMTIYNISDINVHDIGAMILPLSLLPLQLVQNVRHLIQPATWRCAFFFFADIIWM